MNRIVPIQTLPLFPVLDEAFLLLPFVHYKLLHQVSKTHAVAMAGGGTGKGVVVLTDTRYPGSVPASGY
jgi:hypothetical protein